VHRSFAIKLLEMVNAKEADSSNQSGCAHSDSIVARKHAGCVHCSIELRSINKKAEAGQAESLLSEYKK
jgi:hypothetical protein